MDNCKTFFIRTYGCQMNELDSEVIKGILKKRGMALADEEKADLLIYNTCAIRDLAERKVMGKLGIISRKKKRQIIGIAGCMPMVKKEALFQKFPFVDFILGPNNLTDLNRILDELGEQQQKIIQISDTFEENVPYLEADRESKIKAFVSIIRGCNKFCSYCVVPYTRGREVSRPSKTIIEEVKQLRDKGYKEITLLGQNVNSYGKDRKEDILFHELLYHLDQIKGIERIHFMTSHPVDITLDLMHAIKELPSVCEFVHFPLQAGSNRILKKMNRIYTVEEYLEKVAQLKQIIPHVALGTDIIVGFPTETEEDYQKTCDIFQEVRFSTAYIFAYSPRKNTPAHRFKDDIAEETKQMRLNSLLDLYKKTCQKRHETFIGKTVEVLVERYNKDNLLLQGRTRARDKVISKGSTDLIGTLQNIFVEKVHHQTLLGKLETKTP